MNFDYTPKVQALREKLLAFFDEHIYPNERATSSRDRAPTRAAGNAWVPTELIEQLKDKHAMPACGTCSCPTRERGAGLTNLEYAPLCEIMGRVPWAPEVFNCSRPTPATWRCIERYGSPSNKRAGSNRCCKARSVPRS
jgi:acyl-CoA dehydrogenase